jgi:methylamine dehydrogenase accessory protein MauD
VQLIILSSHIALWLVVLALAFVLLGTLRCHGLLDWRLTQLEATTPSRIGRSGLKPGAKAPDFTLPNVTRGEVSLGAFAGRKVLLVFVQTGCAPCHAIAPELNRFAARNESIQLLVINNATMDEARKYACEVNAQFPVLVQEKWSLSKRYEVFATPYGFLIDEQGHVAAKGIVASKEHIGYLLASVASRKAIDGHATLEGADTEANGTERGARGNSLSLSLKEVQHV